MTASPALTIAVAQPACRARDVAANAIAHAEIIRTASARVIAFPELSLTGYELDAAAIDPADERLRPVIDACSAAGSVAFIGAPTTDDLGDHISVLAVDAVGSGVAYRKMWLSDEEAERFAPGPSPVVVGVDGWRLGLAICKDTGVPEHAEATARLGMDVYVAGVLDSADDASVQTERAHRVTKHHRVWVAVASFAGSTGGGYETAAAQSRIWSPDGVVVASAGPEVGRIARATLTTKATAR